MKWAGTGSKKNFQTLSWCISAVLAVVATTASALPGTFLIEQIYSNADGTVQFVVIFDRGMNDCDSGENLWAGQTLVSSGPRPMATFTFPANLPTCATSGRNMLIATEGFAALRLVVPDFVIPNGFVQIPAGTLVFANVSRVTYTALPSDGVRAILTNGSVVQNVATNLAGAYASVVPPVSHEGLWLKGDESGWGVNVTHQGTTLFATWFTYDTDGSGMWLVASSVAQTSPGNFSGALYRTVGPAFSANPFNSISFPANYTQVGTLSFSFSDANTGTMSYTVNGVSQSKAIQRFIYATGGTNCTLSGAQGASPNYQDLWLRSADGATEAGWGINITHQGDILFATWFTYLPGSGSTNKGLWVVMSNGAKTAPGVYTGALQTTTGPAFSAVPFNPDNVARTTVGSGTFTFTDANNGTLNYTLNGVTQSKPIARFIYASPATVCQ